MVTIIQTNNEFNEIVASKSIVVIDFFATWCMPCKMLAPVLDDVAAQKADWTIIKVDVDKFPELAQRYMVSSIPHIEVVEGGVSKGTIVGYRDKKELIQDIAKLL